MKPSPAPPFKACIPARWRPAKGTFALFSTLALALAVALTTASVLLTARLEKSRSDLIVVRLNLYLDEISLLLENGLRFGLELGNVSGSRRVAQEILTQNPDTRFIAVYDEKDRTIMVVGEPTAAAGLHIARRTLHDATNASVGEVRIGFAMGPLQRELDTQYARLMVAACSLAVAGLTLALIVAARLAHSFEKALAPLDALLLQASAKPYVLACEPRLGALSSAVAELENIERQAERPGHQ